jgi:hypothetical protein
VLSHAQFASGWCTHRYLLDAQGRGPARFAQHNRLSHGFSPWALPLCGGNETTRYRTAGLDAMQCNINRPRV